MSGQLSKKQNTSTAALSRDRMDTADVFFSYESLPPNFSLSANMLAGAFAGIAVRRRIPDAAHHGY
jgi:hypothetical protein